MTVIEILEKLKRGEALSKDERILYEDHLQDEERKKPSPEGHQWRISGKPCRAPDVQDVAYGPHGERNLLDLWLAKSERPAPLLVCLHGGGFRAGAKTLVFALRPIALEAGIAVACINYRYSQIAPYPAPMLDGARAVQFLRHNAARWNIDPRRVAACGNSAGAGIALWLAMHKDLADPAHADPVARQSTRLSCAVVYGAQTSYDPRFIKKEIQGPAYTCTAISDLFGIRPEQLDAPPPDACKLMEDCASINHVGPGAPPAYFVYGAENRPSTPQTSVSDGIHHPTFGLLMKRKMDALGIECHFRCLGDSVAGFPTELQFLQKHLKM